MLSDEFLLDELADIRKSVVHGKPEALRDAICSIDSLIKLIDTPEKHQLKVENYIVRFGQYKGKTIAEIGDSDRPYLVWVYTRMEMVDWETKKMIGYYLGILKK